MTEYHNLINRLAHGFSLTQQSIEENECGKFGHLSYFHSFEALHDAFEVQFQRHW